MPSRATLVLVCCVLVAGVPGCSNRTTPSVERSVPAVDIGEDAAPAERAAAVAARLSDQELVGQVLMPFAYGSDATKVTDAAAAANRKAFGVATPAEIVDRHHLGGLILVRQAADPTGDTNPTSNIESPEQVRRLTDGLQRAARRTPAATQAGVPLPLLIGTDQEHGVVTRIRDGMTLLPTAMAFGAAGDPKLTRRAWRMAGAELAAAGVNVDFAPTADVTAGARNTVIGSRSYGSRPRAVAEQVAAAVQGLRDSGVAATLKHFPGHGHTAADSHTELPVLSYGRARLVRRDLPPFAAGIAAGAELVMSGHLDVRSLDPGVPATFSRRVLVDLLRDELGFDGVVVSDALTMQPARAFGPGEAAVRAVLAGNDLLLMPPDPGAARQGLLDALDSGRLPRERLVEAATRVLALRLTRARSSQPGLSVVDSGKHRRVADRAAAAAVTLLRGDCGTASVSSPVRITGGVPDQREWLAGSLRDYGIGTRGPGRPTHIHLTGYGDRRSDLARGAAVTVSMDTPYLLRHVRSPTVLAAFGANRHAMGAVAAVLAGRARAPGRSPVPVAGLPASACG